MFEKKIAFGLMGLVFLFLVPVFTKAQTGDLELIRKRMMEDIQLVKVQDSQVESIRSKINADGSFKDVDYSDLSRLAGYPHQKHLSYLLVLARAYQQPGLSSYRSSSVMELLQRALNYWAQKDYVGENWHDSQITTPDILADVQLLVGNELPRELVEKIQPIIGRANMNASGARPSGDRIVIAGILARNLLFRGDKEELEKVIKIIEGELKFATGERGLQHDFSFHHRVDRVNNTTSYGYSKYANAFGEWMSYVAGTRYQFSKEKANLLADYYLEGIAKQQVYGVYEDVSVKNRDITGKSAFVPRSTLELERVLAATDYRHEELEELIALRKGLRKPSKSFAKFFWQTEHFVFQRPGFYTTVRMFSTRNRNMEEPYNGPGKTTHHRADGTNYLQLKGNEYLNIWPVYDWQKISGTTILQKPQLHGPTEIQKKGLTSFVGAITDGLYGAVVFDFKSPHDLVEAKKAWFFFDEEYVCLGNQIQSDSKLPVATTINQVLLRSAVTAGVAGKKEVMPAGNRSLDQLKWVYHDRVGYVFPQPATVQLSNQVETGSWASITDQKNVSNEPVKEEVFKLWFDHGKSPQGASYQYMVVPNVEEDALVKSLDNNRQVRILSNNDTVQAVFHEKLDQLQAAFYQAGSLSFGKGLSFQMDSQGMALLQLQGSSIKALTVADPSRKLNRLSVVVSGVYHLEAKDLVCVPDVKKQQTVLVIELPRGVYAGKSRTIEFKK